MFDPELKIGQIFKNTDIIGIFKCGNMGGMRRSKTTNTSVIASDYPKGIYHDQWVGGVLFRVLPILLLTGSNNMLNFALICHIPHCQSKPYNPLKPL